MKYKHELRILSGLPGSGKSTYAQRCCVESRYGTRVLPLDDINGRDFNEFVEDYISTYDDDILYVDGLFLTNKDRANIINRIADVVGAGNIKSVITIIEWSENRKACEANDRGRRSKSSKTTIFNAVFEPTDPEVVQAAVKFPCKINVKNIETKEFTIKEKILLEANAFFDKNNRNCLVSESWSGGGTWGNCWGDSGTCDPEPPKEFTELDDLLGKFCPDISFLQYKRVLSTCVTTESRHDYDYYGGSTIEYYYRCDLNKLADFLVENKLV